MQKRARSAQHDEYKTQQIVDGTWHGYRSLTTRSTRTINNSQYSARPHVTVSHLSNHALKIQHNQTALEIKDSTAQIAWHKTTSNSLKKVHDIKYCIFTIYESEISTNGVYVTVDRPNSLHIRNVM